MFNHYDFITELKPEEIIYLLYKRKSHPNTNRLNFKLNLNSKPSDRTPPQTNIQKTQTPSPR